MDATSLFDYSPEVLKRFTEPGHAGALDCVDQKTVSADSGSREAGAIVRLWLRLEEGRVKRARFEAYGCPHFIAAADALAEWCEGRNVDTLQSWGWQSVQDRLRVPVAKRSRLLILQNALKNAHEKLISTPGATG